MTAKVDQMIAEVDQMIAKVDFFTLKKGPLKFI